MSNTKETAQEIDYAEAAWDCLVKKQALMHECHALAGGSAERAEKHAEWSAMAKQQRHYEALASLNA